MLRQRHRLRVFIAIFILSAIYFFIFSKSGLLERRSLENKKERLLKRIEIKKNENKKFGRLLQKYRQGEQLDLDILNSGYVRRGGKIIFFSGLNSKGSDKSDKNKFNKEFKIDIYHLRIIWIALSAVILIIILYYGRGSENDEV